MCWFLSHTVFFILKGKRRFAVCVGTNKSAIPCHAKGKEFSLVPSFSPGIIYASYPGKCFSIVEYWINKLRRTLLPRIPYFLNHRVFSAYNTCKIQFLIISSQSALEIFAYFHVIIVISFPASQKIFQIAFHYSICMWYIFF